LTTDVGEECLPATSACVTPPPIIATPVSVVPVGPSAVEFSWRAKGRPHLAVEPGMQAVCPRLSVYIWHRVVGRIECGPTGPRVTTIRIVGSRFPTHRAFVNGVPTPVVPQGDLANLWSSDPSEVTLVR
jgi:hypothetical protein